MLQCVFLNEIPLLGKSILPFFLDTINLHAVHFRRFFGLLVPEDPSSRSEENHVSPRLVPGRQPNRQRRDKPINVNSFEELIEVKPTIPPSLYLLSSLIFLACLLTGPHSGRADTVQAQQWQITADKMTRYESPRAVIAEGNVVLKKTETIKKKRPKQQPTDWSTLLEEAPRQADQTNEETVTETKTLTTIKADWIAYDVDMGTIKARGNLFIQIGPDKLTADGGQVDLNNETGTFENATIIRQHKDMHLQARKIEKTGALSYHIEDGWIITCKLKKGETPPWSFAAADADITDNGYAFLKHATFRIKNVPVLYTPYLIIPTKRTRQTGFLFPSFSSSDRDGFGVELPFFINLSPSSDITLYPQYLDKRGFMAGAEFRYVLSQYSKGSFMANYLDDDLSDPSEESYFREGHFTHTNQERYWVRGKADQDFGDAWTTRLDLDIVSDRDYLTEFNSGLTGFTRTHDRFMRDFGRGFQNRTEDRRKNSLLVLHTWDNGMSLQGELLGINDLREPETAPTPQWKLPSVDFTGLLPLYDTSIDFSWDASYVYYWRDQGVRSHRLDLAPLLTMAVPLSDYLETTVSAGIRNTSYLIDDNGDPDWADSDTENRFLANLGAEIGTTMIRDFTLNIGDVQGWSHTFRPSISYGYISDVDQEDLPQFDSVDNIADENTLYYNLDNFFSISGSSDNRPFSREYGYIKIRQGYDFRSAESDTPWTPVNVKIGYYPLKDFRLVYKTDIDVYGEGVTFYSLEADYRDHRGDWLTADYRYDEKTNINSIKADARLQLFANLAAGYSVERSIEDSRTLLENFSLIYQAACWSVELGSNYTPGNQKYTLMFRLANIGNPLGIDLPGL